MGLDCGLAPRLRLDLSIAVKNVPQPNVNANTSKQQCGGEMKLEQLCGQLQIGTEIAQGERIPKLSGI